MKKTIDKNKIDNRRLAIRIAFIIIVLLYLFMFEVIYFRRSAPAGVESSDSYELTDDKWALSPGGEEFVKIKKLGQYFQYDHNSLSIYYKLPEFEGEKGFVYRSKDVYTKLFVGDTLLYETQVYEHDWYNKSPGNSWNQVRVPQEYSGQTVELQVQCVYGKDAVTVDHVYFGEIADIKSALISDKIFALIVSVLMVMFGIVLIAFDFIPIPGVKRVHNLLFLGIFSAIMGVWCLLETNVVQFFFSDGRLIQLMDNSFMILAPLPLFLYLDGEFDILSKIAYRIVCIVILGFMFACFLGQTNGLTDMHNMIKLSLGCTALLFVLTMILVIENFVKEISEKQLKIDALLQITGIVLLVFVSFGEMARYLGQDSMDRAISIRIGMLLFIILFGVAAEIRTFSLTSKGMRYSFVKDLAYKDGLTKLSNRTSYLEDIEALEENESGSVGFVFLDVNNLKLVNDTLGHDAGDELIILAAQTISDSFGKFGKCYRIGGDEFCVIMTAGDLNANYLWATAAFNIAVDNINNSGKYPFDFQVAHGFSECRVITKANIKYAIDKADELMYENKKEQKI